MLVQHNLPIFCNQMCLKTPEVNTIHTSPTSYFSSSEYKRHYLQTGLFTTIDIKTKNSPTSMLIPALHQASTKACNPEEHSPDSAAFPGPPSSSSPKEILLGGGKCWATRYLGGCFQERWPLGGSGVYARHWVQCCWRLRRLGWLRLPLPKHSTWK